MRPDVSTFVIAGSVLGLTLCVLLSGNDSTSDKIRTCGWSCRPATMAKYSPTDGCICTHLDDAGAPR